MEDMPGITIFGAGIAGLALGHCLQKKGIQALILEKAPSPSYHTYGLTLHSWAYQPLANNVLGEPVDSFRSFVSVDNHLRKGKGQLSGNNINKFQACHPESFRAHRGRLEAFLRKGLNIKYKHQLTSIETTEQHEITLKFKNDIPSITLDSRNHIIIGADGVHSELRTLLSPSFDITTLPYVVFNGRRKVPKQDFEMYYAPEMNGSNFAERLVPFHAHPRFANQNMNILLQIHVNDYRSDGEIIDISYTFSRPSYATSGGVHDPLHRPNRSKDEATQIPDAFFDELKLLRGAGIPHPFLHTFNPARVRKDKVLHWLMRNGMMSLEELERAAAGYSSKAEKTPGTDTENIVSKGISGCFMFIGDAVHPTPILGGGGANDAIRDGIELAEFIARHGYKGVGKFYTQQERVREDTMASDETRDGERRERWVTWRDGVHLSEKVIKAMHGMHEGQDQEAPEQSLISSLT